MIGFASLSRWVRNSRRFEVAAFGAFEPLAWSVKGCVVAWKMSRIMLERPILGSHDQK